MSPIAFLSIISIHSLRMEGDYYTLHICTSMQHFNPLPPHGGRLFLRPKSAPGREFQSTPSAWRETLLTAAVETIRENFNPLPPHGGRPFGSFFAPSGNGFQSTPSAWRETTGQQLRSLPWIFQSTPSAWRETLCDTLEYAQKKLFQSTPSAWRET